MWVLVNACGRLGGGWGKPSREVISGLQAQPEFFLSLKTKYCAVLCHAEMWFAVVCLAPFNCGKLGYAALCCDKVCRVLLSCIMGFLVLITSTNSVQEFHLINNMYHPMTALYLKNNVLYIFVNCDIKPKLICNSWACPSICLTLYPQLKKWSSWEAWINKTDIWNPRGCKNVVLLKMGYQAR